MKSLMYRSSGGSSVAGYTRNGIFAARTSLSVRPYIGVTYPKRRHRTDQPRASFQVLRFGRDLLLLLWATAALAFFLTVFAGFVLR